MERRGLLDWLEDPRVGYGLRFAGEQGGWGLWDYPRLAAAVLAQAERISRARARRDGVVSIVTGGGPGFVAAFIGALAAGNTPSPLSPPGFGADPAEYVARTAAALRVAAPTLVLADEALLGPVGEAARLAGLEHEPQQLAPEGPGPATFSRAAPADLALLQFTSGSTGRPRGVRVRWRNLEANIAMIGRWLGLGPEEATATWLPLYHDMGLIGCLLTPIVNQTDVWILRPEQFVADPARWLGCFGSLGASLTASPTFGFAYAARRASEEALEAMDFSSWRVAIVGAERVDPSALGRFAARMRPHGFSASAFLPAYGLAEATLAVTGVAPGSGARAIRPEWANAQTGEPLQVGERASLTEGAGIDGAGWLVGCGPPHPGTTVTVVDEEGQELPPGHLGEIVVRGDAVAAGYEGESTAHATRFENDAVHTADAGVLLDGELFVLGRLGDAISVRGRTVFAEDVELHLAAVDGVGAGRCVVLAGADEGVERVAALVEREPGPWADAVAAVIRSQVGADAAVEVWAGARGTIQRTSSGKPRRRPMWDAICENSLAAERIWPRHPSG